ncbi:tetratricopeptide repeat protein [Streptomyces cyaneochromogenes]|uniref:Tetratricopeptide repeat protein n=1 Tax=Streptomyces cyaneochromogenes TaxID=2496836 RepID=A0A3S9MJ78_9ACTN|nr:tetratricopeptide repeat protein [Streptomyces cyaneochromogenes]AZQ39229.1 tetratricopeptide repeat protein [Streptomyces cyaneochromogenes]
MGEHGTGDPRLAFAAELTRLRRRLPDVPDEALARRAGAVVLPSGRRVTVDARRLGEWTSGRSVPRQFEAVMALVRAVEQATGGVAADRTAVARWQGLWRAAREHRSDRLATGLRERITERPQGVQAPIVIGRPPSDAAALRRRQEFAERIDDGLADDSVRRILLTGAGGVGKSQLAAAAFHRAKRRSELLLWVAADNRASVLDGYARAWRALSRASVTGEGATPGTDPGSDDETQADLFLAWLRSTATSWLVVLDDVDDLGEVAGLWPEGDAGRAVVTTRRRDAVLLRPGVRVIPVGVFTAEEATGYLADRLSLDPDTAAGPAGLPAHRPEDLVALTSVLGHFPLALSQAAAFLIDTGMDLPSYLNLLTDERENLAGLFPSSSPADEHGGTVTSTLQLALARAESLAPPGAARALLELISVLAPDGIPEGVLLSSTARAWLDGDRCCERGEPPERGALTERGALPARSNLLALRALHRLSLVTHQEPSGTAVVEVHSLVQRVVRDGVRPDRRAAIATAAADALEEVWSAPDCAPESTAVLYRCAEALLAHAGDHLWYDAGMHPLLRRLGTHLAGLGRHDAARTMATQLADRARRQLPADHRDLLTLRAQVAQAEGDLGNTTEAVRLLADLRREAEDSLGPADPDTLSIRLHEARWRMETGLIVAALADFDALAAEARAVLAPHDPLVTAAEEHVALCRGLSGDAVGARDAYAALARDLERSLGPRHPSTLRVLSDLSRWIGETGDVRTAVATYQKAVDGLVSVLGRLHHDTLIARHNLAYWHGIAGDHDLAVEQFVTAADDAEAGLGTEHPTTLTCQTNLAFWRGVAGDTVAAVEQLGLLHQTVERVFGADHPRSLRIRQQRAELLYSGGDHTTAVTQLTAVLADMVRVQGTHHPRTRETERLLADWSQEPTAAP